MYRPLEEEAAPALEPAPLGTRLAAGALDLFGMMLLAALFMALPMVVAGGSLPLLSVAGAVIVWSVAPLSAFGATLGMRLFGLVLVDSRSGALPDVLEVLFRELVGRGMFAVAWLGTSLMGLTLALFGVADFRFPLGLGLLMQLLALLLLAGATVGHFFILARPDRRGLADLMAHTVMASAASRAVAAPPVDAEEADWARQRQRSRLKTFVAAQVLVAGAAAAGPLLSTAQLPWTALLPQPTLEPARTAFEAEPGSAVKARALIRMLSEAGRYDDAAEVQRRHLEAVTVANARRELLLRDSLAQSPTDPTILTLLIELLEEEGRVDEASATYAGWVSAAGDPDLRASYGVWLYRRDLNEEAVRALQAALAEGLESPPAEAYLGLALQDLGRLEEARAVLASAVEKAPDFDEARGALAEVEAALAAAPAPSP